MWELSESVTVERHAACEKEIPRWRSWGQCQEQGSEGDQEPPSLSMCSQIGGLVSGTHTDFFLSG